MFLATDKSSKHSIQSIASSNQSDKQMLLNLNINGFIADEKVEEITEQVSSFTCSVAKSVPQSESSKKDDINVESVEEESRKEDEETKINNCEGRPAVYVAAPVSQFVLADAFKAGDNVNEMDAINGK